MLLSGASLGARATASSRLALTVTAMTAPIPRATPSKKPCKKDEPPSTAMAAAKPDAARPPTPAKELERLPTLSVSFEVECAGGVSAFEDQGFFRRLATLVGVEPEYVGGTLAAGDARRPHDKSTPRQADPMTG